MPQYQILGIQVVGYNFAPSIFEEIWATLGNFAAGVMLYFPEDTRAEATSLCLHGS